MSKFNVKEFDNIGDLFNKFHSVVITNDELTMDVLDSALYILEEKEDLCWGIKNDLRAVLHPKQVVELKSDMRDGAQHFGGEVRIEDTWRTQNMDYTENEDYIGRLGMIHIYKSDSLKPGRGALFLVVETNKKDVSVIDNDYGVQLISKENN